LDFTSHIGLTFDYSIKRPLEGNIYQRKSERRSNLNRNTCTLKHEFSGADCPTVHNLSLTSKEKHNTSSICGRQEAATDGKQGKVSASKKIGDSLSLFNM
jgi:hypothetical protein